MFFCLWRFVRHFTTGKLVCRRAWNIALCDVCGSSGTHLKCSGLSSAKDEWICPGCAVICPPSKPSKSIQNDLCKSPDRNVKVRGLDSWRSSASVFPHWLLLFSRCREEEKEDELA